VPVPEEGGIALGDVVWVSAKADGTGTEAAGICAGSEVVVAGAGIAAAHLISAVVADWPAAARSLVG